MNCVHKVNDKCEIKMPPDICDEQCDEYIETSVLEENYKLTKLLALAIARFRAAEELNEHCIDCNVNVFGPCVSCKHYQKYEQAIAAYDKAIGEGGNNE